MKFTNQHQLWIEQISSHGQVQKVKYLVQLVTYEKYIP